MSCVFRKLQFVGAYHTTMIRKRCDIDTRLSKRPCIYVRETVMPPRALQNFTRCYGALYEVAKYGMPPELITMRRISVVWAEAVAQVLKKGTGMTRGLGRFKFYAMPCVSFLDTLATYKCIVSKYSNNFAYAVEFEANTSNDALLRLGVMLGMGVRRVDIRFTGNTKYFKVQDGFERVRVFDDTPSNSIVSSQCGKYYNYAVYKSEKQGFFEVFQRIAIIVID
jgi:hypothetical protein